MAANAAHPARHLITQLYTFPRVIDGLFFDQDFYCEPEIIVVTSSGCYERAGVTWDEVRGGV